MVAVVNVCAWCNHELLESNEPGKKHEAGCTVVMVSHSCCNQCRKVLDAKIKAVRVSRRLEYAVKVPLGLAAAGLEG